MTSATDFAISRYDYAAEKWTSALEDIERLERELTTARQRASAWRNEVQRLGEE